MAVRHSIESMILAADVGWTPATVASMIVAGIALLGVITAAVLNWRATATTVVQKAEADSRMQWWARASWAMERANSSDGVDQQIAIEMLSHLGRSKLVSTEEQQMLADMAIMVLLYRKHARIDDQWRAAAFGEPPGSVLHGHPRAESLPDQAPVHLAATPENVAFAELLQQSFEKLGRPLPEWVKLLAAGRDPRQQVSPSASMTRAESLDKLIEQAQQVVEEAQRREEDAKRRAENAEEAAEEASGRASQMVEMVQFRR